MNISRGDLLQMLKFNICEVKSVKRRPKKNGSLTRRMLCTNDPSILETPDGRVVLNYRPTTGAPIIIAEQYNLINTWDIFMQDYRNISMGQCQLIATIKSEDWWQYFNDNILNMSQQDKIAFMDT